MIEYETNIERAARIWRLCRACAASLFVGHVAPDLSYTRRVARLLFGTAAQESALTWERQRSPRFFSNVGGFSKWQLEAGSVYESLALLKRNPDLLARSTEWLFADANATSEWATTWTPENVLFAMRLDDNDKIGALFCRLHYYRVPAAIPDSLEDQAAYWKEHYNTRLGAGTVDQYTSNWNRYCKNIVG